MVASDAGGGGMFAQLQFTAELFSWVLTEAEALVERGQLRDEFVIWVSPKDDGELAVKVVERSDLLALLAQTTWRLAQAIKRDPPIGQVTVLLQWDDEPHAVFYVPRKHLWRARKSASS